MSGPDPVLAFRIAAAVSACPSVLSLAGGPNGTSATYGPGERVVGVCLKPATVEVHVVSAWGVPAADVAAEIRAVVRPQLPDHDVDVFVEDVGDAATGPVNDLGVAS